MLSQIHFVTASLIQAAVVVVPAYILAAVKRSKPIAFAATLTFVLYILQAVILTMPNSGVFAELRFNWWQKTVVFGLTLAGAYCLKRKGIDAGLNRASSKNAYLWALLLGGLCSLPALLGDYLSGDVNKATAEYLLFELSLPGLHEEPFYRGILLCIWDQAIGRPYKFMGVQFGWGAVISGTLFVLGHLLSVDKNFHVLIVQEFLPWFDLLFFTIAITWLRYKFSSFWPGVLAHNVGNEIEALVAPYLGKPS